MLSKLISEKNASGRARPNPMIRHPHAIRSPKRAAPSPRIPRMLLLVERLGSPPETSCRCTSAPLACIARLPNRIGMHAFSRQLRERLVRPRDEDPVTDPRQILVLGARNQHRHTFRRELLQQIENRVLRAYVHPLGRLVQKQHLRPCEQPFPEQRFPPVS